MQFFRPPVRAVVAVRIAGLVAAVSSTALLAACVPDLGQLSQIKPPTSYVADKTLGAPTAIAWPAEDWWAAYNDPQLTTLIEEALKGAPDLRVAEARVRQAQAQTQVQHAALLPTVGVTGNIQETGVELNVKDVPSQVKDILPSDLQPFTQLSGKVAYEIDFFGKNRAAVAAASSQ